MKEKKLYEEAQIEIIKFECKDILTTSGAYDNIGTLADSEAGAGGNIFLPETKF